MSRPRLTPHQREVLNTLERWGDTWVNGKAFGRPAALEHLVDKGYAEKEVRYGPRGGEKPYYRVRRGS